jgi:phage baseplate assembly protein W
MKARGLSPKLPLTMDYTDGHALTKTHREMVSQNLKMLILTIPGERIMDPMFGIGLKTFLFEQNNSTTQGAISSKIKEQLGIYMPYIELVNLEFQNTESNSEIGENILYIRLEYWIEPLEVLDVIDLTYDSNKGLIT